MNTAVFGPERLRAEHLEILSRLSIRHVEITAFNANGRHFPLEDAALAEEIRRAAERLSIRVHSLHAPNVDISGPDSERRAEGVRLSKLGVEALVRLGGRYVVQHPTAGLRTEMPDEERMRHAVESLREIAGYAGERGITVAVENMLPIQAFSTSREIMSLLEAVGMPNVKVCFDTSHARLAPEGIEMARGLSSRIATIHASDNDGRRDDHVVPGTGVVDWAGFKSILQEIGYNSVFMVELRFLSPARVVAWTLRKLRARTLI